MPMDERPAATVDELLLQSKREFDIAADRAKQIVRGHDEIVNVAFDRIFENITLRKTRQNNRSLGPVASLLLIGDGGIGKRYLARVLSKLLYPSGRVEVFECDRITTESLVGMKDKPGDLLEMVRREPFQLLLFERIDHASADVCKILSQLLSTGRLIQPGTESSVSFQNTIVVMSLGRSDTIDGLDEKSLGRIGWRQRAIDLLRDERQLDGGLLSAVDEILLCESPSDETKSEVISLLLQRECRAHGIELSHVDPVILGTQVMQIDNSTGFEHAPNRIKKLLSKPLVAASAAGHDSLSLRVAADSGRTHSIKSDR